MKKKKIIMVDMSATILHHGHIRILRKAKKLGFVIVALTSDEEILKKKKFESPIKYKARKEILESIKYVDKVVKSKWLIDESFLNKHYVDFLFHGMDNKNTIDKKRLKLVKKTKSISSSLLRKAFNAGNV